MVLCCAPDETSSGVRAEREGVPIRSVKRRWRFYETRAGRRPVKEFLDGLSDDDAAAVAAEMHDVVVQGLREARHLRGDVYEVRAEGDRLSIRVLFAPEGRRGQVLLALEAFSKKTRKTPQATLELAERRLADWRSRRKS